MAGLSRAQITGLGIFDRCNFSSPPNLLCFPPTQVGLRSHHFHLTLDQDPNLELWDVQCMTWTAGWVMFHSRPIIGYVKCTMQKVQWFVDVVLSFTNLYT
eukprot:TRINITY_DN31048_c0_g1_i1.p2 TRINITY_DN31048_c0_g1~~TRINITY_DN31048_c0_g1_i1.p2  ORF type:complete len:100 (+),score=4.73 TRINITY_DN31048_c0_g1_i1:271-570(+)